jgi:tricorn protease
MRVRMTVLFCALLAMSCAGVSRAAEETPLLAHSPTLSKTQVVFTYGGYLWSVPREGGDA